MSKTELVLMEALTNILCLLTVFVIFKWFSANFDRNEMTKSKVNIYLYKMAPGIYHSSIVVFGWEYAYGQDGISKKEPPAPVRISEEERYEVAERQKTNKKEEELDAFIRAEEHLWTPQRYDALDHNCQHFTEELCEFLNVSKLPKHAKILPTVLRTVRSSFCSLTSTSTTGSTHKREHGGARRSHRSFYS